MYDPLNFIELQRLEMMIYFLYKYQNKKEKSPKKRALKFEKVLNILHAHADEKERRKRRG
jgi:hypothetical protein